MRDAENQETLISSHVNDAIVTDPQAPKPAKLTTKRFALFSTTSQFLFQRLNDSGDFFLIDALQIFGNGGFVFDLICQDAFSTGGRR